MTYRIKIVQTLEEKCTIDVEADSLEEALEKAEEEYESDDSYLGFYSGEVVDVEFLPGA